MILKTLFLTTSFAFAFANWNNNYDNTVNLDEATLMKLLRLKRASEGNITHFGKRIIINEDQIGGEKQPDGRICFKKVVNVNETEYDRGMECRHRLKKKCHLTYITDYHPNPEKRCETSYQKDCHITFKQVPHNEVVRKCHIPYEHKCGEGIVGPIVCKVVHETVCETTYKEYVIEQDHPNCTVVEELRCTNKTIDLLHLPHNEGEKGFAVKEICEKWPVQKCELKKESVKKVHPDTECKKIPRKICSPSNCNIFPGEEICHEEMVTKIQKIPEEECNLEPHENCRTESTLVPKLVPKKNCAAVPKEICVNTKTNPHIVVRPIVKNWCFNPEEIKKDASE